MPNRASFSQFPPVPPCCQQYPPQETQQSPHAAKSSLSQGATKTSPSATSKLQVKQSKTLSAKCSPPKKSGSGAPTNCEPVFLVGPIPVLYPTRGCGGQAAIAPGRPQTVFCKPLCCRKTCERKECCMPMDCNISTRGSLVVCCGKCVKRKTSQQVKKCKKKHGDEEEEEEEGEEKSEEEVRKVGFK